MFVFSLNMQAILNAPVSISIFDRRYYTGMFKRLLALGAAGIAVALSALPASAWPGGFGCGLGCGCGGLGLGCVALPGWWGPVAAMGWPWGLFGGLGCW